MKRIITVQDFSCVGKCSLTVAIPLVSAFGIEACALPTALLSTHTAFKHWTFANLCNNIPDILTAWKNEDIKFDGFYSGYLGGLDLIEQSKDIIDNYIKKDGIVLVDPAMGDNGKLYVGFDKEYAKATASLCAKADVITPNITEACFMLDVPYSDKYDVDYLNSLCDGLKKLGAKNVIITGVRKGNEVGVYCSYEDGSIYEYFAEREVQDFHGTGDIYSSVFYGALMNGCSLSACAKFACDFVKKCINVTLNEENHATYGVNFEQCTSEIVDFLRSL